MTGWTSATTWSRAVTDGRYLYIRNYMPHRPQGQYLAYMFETPTTQVWKARFDAGTLTPDPGGVLAAEAGRRNSTTWPPTATTCTTWRRTMRMPATLDALRRRCVRMLLTRRDLGLLPGGGHARAQRRPHAL